jgi:hypothetical protein
MRQNSILAIILFSSFCCYSQLSVEKKEGSSVVTKLSMNIKVNDGSTLKREYITINDSNSPIQLQSVGVETSYSSSYSFKPIGSMTAKEPIVAYEVVHQIYNVFGEHMKSLSNTEIIDFESQKEFSKYSSWYASENNVSEYLICVSYVSNVRTKAGKLWHYNFKALKEQLNKLEIVFEEGFEPKKDSEKGK